LVFRISERAALSCLFVSGAIPPIEISSPYAHGSSLPPNDIGTPPRRDIITYDSGFPSTRATALLASLRMSEVTTPSRGTLVCTLRVGIATNQRPEQPRYGTVSNVALLARNLATSRRRNRTSWLQCSSPPGCVD
jgi:hypothetical protein